MQTTGTQRTIGTAPEIVIPLRGSHGLGPAQVEGLCSVSAHLLREARPAPRSGGRREKSGLTRPVALPSTDCRCPGNVNTG